MKLSELIEQYGDVELEGYQIKDMKLESCSGRVAEMVNTCFDIISNKLLAKGYYKLSSKDYSPVLIMDVVNNIHLTDHSQRFYDIVADKETLFLHILYYASDSEYCYEDSDVSKFIEDLNEDQDFEILDVVDRYMEDIEGGDCI